MISQTATLRGIAYHMGWVEYILVERNRGPEPSRDCPAWHQFPRQCRISPVLYKLIRRYSRDPDSLASRQEKGQADQEEHLARYSEV